MSVDWKTLNVRLPIIGRNIPGHVDQVGLGLYEKSRYVTVVKKVNIEYDMIQATK